MSAAERMLQEYQAQYREKEERLRKLEDEINVIKRCLSWINSEDSEETATETHPEKIGSSGKNIVINTPATLFSKPEETDDFMNFPR